MASKKPYIPLEKEDHKRDAEFMKAMHGKSTEAKGGFAAMLAKDKEAKKVAVNEYFKHFDNKRPEEETDADREARTKEYATLTRQYVVLHRPSAM